MSQKTKKVTVISLCVTIVMTLIAIIAVVTLIKNGKNNTIFLQTQNLSDKKATLQPTPDYGQNYVDSIVFLGDFTSYGMLEAEALSGKKESRQIWTGRDGTLDLDYNIDKATIIFPETGEEMLISAALEHKKPRYLVITLGLENGVPYCDKNTFCQYYEKLIEQVKKASPDTCVILQSIFPVTAKYQRKNKEFSNEKIDTCNLWIYSLAENNGVRFLNTAEVLKDNKGNLNQEYANARGNSLNAQGYAKMLEYIRIHGYKDIQPSEEPTEKAS